MFDDIPQKNSAPPGNLPTEPVDMFAGIENSHEVIPGTSGPTAVDAGILKKKLPTSSVRSLPAGMNELAGGYAVRGPILGKVFMVLIILVIASGAGYGAWRLYSYLNSGDNTVVPTDDNAVVAPDTQTPAIQTPEVSNATDTSAGTTVTPATTSTGAGEVLSGEPIDTDRDGLDDVREEELGTNMTNPDTDSDGLTDGDEVLIWKTDPKNPDTDGDSYLDGDEVRHGYNPLGSGKLFNGQSSATGTVPAASATTTASASTTPTSTIPSEDIAI
jgi:Bacterial TSP3 repeat